VGLRVTVYILVTVYSPFVLQQENLVHSRPHSNDPFGLPLGSRNFVLSYDYTIPRATGCQLCARASFVERRPRYRSFIIGRYTIAPFTPKLKNVKKLFS